ncbi:MAG: hypothetical protein ACRBHB_01860 [Arenicella sp.]
MVRSFSLLLLLFFLTSCTAKYINRDVDDGLGGQKNLLFAYGKFCGGGHPANIGRNGIEGKPRTLLGMYPPMDDVDAMCYAHDYCYELEEANNLICDDAFHSMIINYQTEIDAKGCWNLLTDMTIAFFGKNYEKGNNSSETWSSRFVQTLLGVPTAIFWSVLKVPIKLFSADAIEGTCNVADASSPESVIDEFEVRYKNESLNQDRLEINIPIPTPDKQN